MYEAAARPPSSIPLYEVLGVKVAATQIPEVVDVKQGWIEEGGGFRWIAVTGMHGTVEAQDDPSFREVLTKADLVVPDGMPLVWFGRRAGHDLPRRVYGPELMEAFCRETAGRYRHFLYGGPPASPPSWPA